MDNFGDKIILNNEIRHWIIFMVILLGSVIVLRLFQRLAINRIKKLSASTKTTIDDFIVKIIQSSIMPLLYVLAFYFSLKYIEMPARADRLVYIVILLLSTFFISKAIISFISYTFQQAVFKTGKNEQREKQAKGILLIIKVLIWLIGALFVIDNLGYDITTLVAGLGIGGIAIALAAQTILGDLFSYLVIFFDKPFEIGDFIIFQDKMGTIEYIGIKTTRIRTLGGEQLVCSNTDLTNSRVHNYKRMRERRVDFSIGVVYNTAADKLENIPLLIKQAIETQENARFDRAHFKSFGNFSLDFEVIFYVLTPDYTTYMDIQQKINLKIFKLFETNQIEFAFPTQTIFVSNQNENSAFKGNDQHNNQFHN